MPTSARSIDTRTPPTTQGHPWFAASYDFLTQWGEGRVLGPLRQRLVGAATGQVLELGTGTGANFPYYPTGATITATEPDPFMLARARTRAAELRRDIVLLRCQAEALPFADASFGIVVATLVFCSVGDVARALAEVRRVLKPSGTFRFIEHVRGGNHRAYPEFADTYSAPNRGRLPPQPPNRGGDRGGRYGAGRAAAPGDIPCPNHHRRGTI